MIKHGFRKRGKRVKEYTAWSQMMQRCNNPDHPRYKDYGGRGIKVCDRWLVFENFIADVGFAPSKTHSLDRYPDNNGNYEPGNVRWATPTEQNLNQRPRIPIFNGKSAQQYSIELGGDKGLVHARIKKGWSIEAAITTPVKVTGRWAEADSSTGDDKIINPTDKNK